MIFLRGLRCLFVAGITIVTYGASSGETFAQSAVTLYGIAEEGITYVSNEGGHSATLLQSGASSASRWGLRGSDALTGTLDAIFVFENGFDTSTGVLANNGREFGRQAFVGLSSQYGTLTFGRQYDFVVDMLAPVAASLPGTLYFAHAGDVDNTSGSVRINDAVKYSSVSFRGIAFGGLYSFGGQPGHLSQNSGSSFGLSYTNGPLYFATAYLNIRNPFFAAFDGLAPRSAVYSQYVQNATSETVVGGGATYSFGTAKGGFSYTATVFAQGFLSKSVRFDNYDANVRWKPRSDVEIVASYVFTRGRVEATDETPIYREVNLFADYILSKRTDVYFAGSWMRSGGSAKQASITYIPVASSGKNQSLLRLGMRHRF